MKQELTNCHYLEDQSITLFGLKIYGKTTAKFSFSLQIANRSIKPSDINLGSSCL
jgi:hypothetical protein